MTTSTAVDTKNVTKIKPITLWRVVLLNDDYTPMDFVVLVLEQLYNKSAEEAYSITMAIHDSGRGVVNVYTEEIAKQKASDTVKIAKLNGHPLKAIAEPA